MVRARHIYHRHTNGLQQAPRFEVGEQVRCKYGGQWAIGRVVAHNYEEPQVAQNTVPCPFLAAMACTMCLCVGPSALIPFLLLLVSPPMIQEFKLSIQEFNHLSPS